jgi:uncharacterized membrane protein SirB2
MYTIVKHTHMTLMLISVTLLIIRVLATTANAQWVQRKWLKIAPHIIDTLLLVSAIVLMVIIQQYPIIDGWLTAKIIALCAYIVLGTLALKGQKNVITRLAFLLLALSTIGYMIAVAVTKNPTPWIS